MQHTSPKILTAMPAEPNAERNGAIVIPSIDNFNYHALPRQGEVHQGEGNRIILNHQPRLRMRSRDALFPHFLAQLTWRAIDQITPGVKSRKPLATMGTALFRASCYGIRVISSRNVSVPLKVIGSYDGTRINFIRLTIKKRDSTTRIPFNLCVFMFTLVPCRAARLS